MHTGSKQCEDEDRALRANNTKADSKLPESRRDGTAFRRNQPF